MKGKYLLPALLLLTCIIYLGGCGNNASTSNNSSITGTWNWTSRRNLNQVNGNTTLDTTAGIPVGYSTLTFAEHNRLGIYYRDVLHYQYAEHPHTQYQQYRYGEYHSADHCYYFLRIFPIGSAK
ncbi:MAG: hypothetical protein JWO03_2926 [Bacteroidetes bacterium]|nr:hypothetical protein [Bacteroidota bacterium]